VRAVKVAADAETAENTTTTTNTSAASEAASSASASVSSAAAATTEKPEPELKSDVRSTIACSLFSYLVDKLEKRDHHHFEMMRVARAENASRFASRLLTVPSSLSLSLSLK